MLGFICALDVEVEGIKSLMDNKTEETFAKITYAKGEIFGQEVVCCECGIGKVNAAMSTQMMIDLYHPDVIINSGIAGSLSPDIRIGDLVVSDDCVQHDMDGTEMGEPLGQIQFNDEKRIYLPADQQMPTARKLQAACADLDDTAVFRGRIASGDVFIVDLANVVSGSPIISVLCLRDGGRGSRSPSATATVSPTRCCAVSRTILTRTNSSTLCDSAKLQPKNPSRRSPNSSKTLDQASKKRRPNDVFFYCLLFDFQFILDDVRGVLKPVTDKQLDGTGIDRLREIGVERHLCQHAGVEILRRSRRCGCRRRSYAPCRSRGI